MWAQMRSQMQTKMFAKADANGSGGVDKTELNSLFNDMAQKAGSTASSTDTDKLFAKMDGNGDGTLSADELSTGMQSLMQPPPTTMDFAQSRSSSDAAGGGAGQDLFAKVDTNGDGNINKSEMQALMDQMKGGTGSSGTGASSGTDSGKAVSDLFAKLDTNGDGSLSKAEFEAGRPKGQHGGATAAGGDMPPPPPMGGGAPGATSGSSASTTYDPLDTNQDGTVSVAERLAGASNSDGLKALFKAIDGDGDGKLSSSETNTFAQKLSSLVSSKASTGTTEADKQSSGSFDAGKLARMLYDQVAQGLSAQANAQSVSAMA
jgi:hypothetical protein